MKKQGRLKKTVKRVRAENKRRGSSRSKQGRLRDSQNQTIQKFVAGCCGHVLHVDDRDIIFITKRKKIKSSI